MLTSRTCFSILAALLCAPCAHSDASWWAVLMGTPYGSAAGAAIGVWPGSADGYDRQPKADTAGLVGVALLHYRQTGEHWTGPTGFFGTDYESPIPVGGGKTWPDVYLWSQEYVPPGNVAEVLIGPDFSLPPRTYRLRLVIDYVPPELAWSGPMEFDLPLTRSHRIILPVPVVDEGLQGTRMHITVYDTIPEPSTLALLAFGAAAIGFRSRRARRPRRL